VAVTVVLQVAPQVVTVLLAVVVVLGLQWTMVLQQPQLHHLVVEVQVQIQVLRVVHLSHQL
jgi:hypothetical protein